MSFLPGLNYRHQALPREFKLPAKTGTAMNVAEARKTQRLRTWEISPTFHCSIIGTCLSTVELRQLLVKIGDVDARTAGEHALHGRGVRTAGQRDVAGKLLNKVLDRRHEMTIKRFSKTSDLAELRNLWREAFDRGEIAGAYWAILSHPATDIELTRDVFGEVHMLSHLVGSASRLDIARLNTLQKELEEKNEKSARQEQRLAMAAAEQAGLKYQIEQLQEKLVRAEAVKRGGTVDAERIGAGPALLERLDAERTRAEALTERLKSTEAREKQARERAEEAGMRAAALQRENDLLEAVLLGGETGDAAVESQQYDGAILYVGGRRSNFDRLRALAAERDIALLLHDGGMEDSTTLLPVLVGQAVAVIFPVDHISHTAAGLIKRICRETGKPFIPLRSAGLASFIATIARPGLAGAAS